MTSHRPSTDAPTRAGRARTRRQQERVDLAHHHAELLRSVGHLRELASRLWPGGPDPDSRRLAATVVQQMDTLLPHLLAREARRLSPSVDEAGDAGAQQAAYQLRADHGWITANWYELRPLLDGIARDQSWVDPDHLRDAADLFCTLLDEHVGLAAALLARSARRAGLEAAALP